MDCEAEVEDKLYQIGITFRDGENEYTEHVNFYGRYKDAVKYGDKYLEDYMGKGYREDGWLFEPPIGVRAAKVMYVREFKYISAETNEGGLLFPVNMDFRVAEAMKYVRMFLNQYKDDDAEDLENPEGMLNFILSVLEACR